VDNYQKQEKVKIVPQKDLIAKEKLITTLKTEKIKTQKALAKISQDKVELEEKIPTMVTAVVQTELQKIDTLKKNEAMRFRFPQRINSYVDPDRKPFADIPFSYMRRMAQIYPIARACINRRIRQVTQLEWEVTTIDEIDGEVGFETQIKVVNDFFKHPMGPNTRLRELLTIMVDDLLTVDAISFEYQRMRSGQFMFLVPVDPTTIALRVTDIGATPMPPDNAYVQIIQGREIASFSTEEMLYDFIGNRSYSPYGFAPLESLILQAESAIRGSLYNLSYFRENNVPEGFVDLPEDIATSKEQIEEWQMWFDALLAGDNRMIHRLKFLPAGAKYTPVKKPEDMAFERFELWLLQQTCAVFDVQPQDIGITLHVNKATANSQSDIGKERGLIPLTNFVKEIFDDIIQVKLGYENLQFKWGNINPVDKKEEADIGQIQIDSGQRSVDELRINEGLEPIGLKHFIMTTSGPMFVEDLIAGKVGPKASADNAAKAAEAKANAPIQPNNFANADLTEFEKAEQLELADIRKWRKCIYKDLELNKPLRMDFQSEYIRPEITEEIREGLQKVGSKVQAKILFDIYLDDEIKSAMTLLKHAQKLRELETNASLA